MQLQLRQVSDVKIYVKNENIIVQNYGFHL